jgi:hypothetical protein
MVALSRTRRQRFRVSQRPTGRRRLNLVIGFMGFGIVVVLVVAAVRSTSEGSTTGILTGLGMLLTAALAAFLYGPETWRVLRLTVSRRPFLLLDEEAIRVTHGAYLADMVEASTSWTNCAVVVVSPLVTPRGHRLRYVSFVPSDPAAVTFPAGSRLIGHRAQLIHVPEALAALTSFFSWRNRSEVRELVGWVRHHHPEVRIIESGRASAQHLVDGDPGGGGAALGEAVERAEVAGGGEAGHEESGEGGLEPR